MAWTLDGVPQELTMTVMASDEEQGGQYNRFKRQERAARACSSSVMCSLAVMAMVNPTPQTLN